MKNMLIQECYRKVTTRVRSTLGMTENFKVNVGLHQGSALSPFLFNKVFDVVTEEVRENPHWCLLYADALCLDQWWKNKLVWKMKFTLEYSVASITRGKYQECCVTERYQ
jgi:hypothetical protein